MNATLTIPDLDEATARELQIQAGDHGRTIEAEAREILTQAVAKKVAFDQAAFNASKQAFLALAGSLDLDPDLSSKRGFER